MHSDIIGAWGCGWTFCLGTRTCFVILFNMNDDICNFWIHPSLFKRPVILKLQTPEIADSVANDFFYLVEKSWFLVSAERWWFFITESCGNLWMHNIIELDNGRILTGKPQKFDGKKHGFRLKFSQQNQSSDNESPSIVGCLHCASPSLDFGASSTTLR